MGDQRTGPRVVVGGREPDAPEPRDPEHSLGHQVLDFIRDTAGSEMHRLDLNSPEGRAHAMRAFDLAMSGVSALASNKDAKAEVKLRILAAGLVVMGFALVGVFGWFQNQRLSALEETMAQDRAALDKLEERRDAIDGNIKALAGHAVALTENVNASNQTNYSMLLLIAAKIGADVPANLKAPAPIEPPVTLRYLAGER